MNTTAAPEVVPEHKSWPFRAYSDWSMYERRVGLAMAIGTLVRLVFVLWLHPPERFDYSDMHSYIQTAKDFADFSRSSDSGDWYYPTGTATFLSVFLVIFGKAHGLFVASIWQALISGAEIGLVFIAARRFFGERIGSMASLLVATHYLYISYSGLFMSESYLSLGLITACAAFVPEKPARVLLAGFLLGIGAWAKSQAFLLAPLWAALLFFRGQRKSALAVLVGVSVVVVPVSIVCMYKTGVPAFISTNGGQTFALGQCPIKSIVSEDPQGHWTVAFGVPNLYQRVGRGEVEATWEDAHFYTPFNHSGYYMKVGMNCLKKYPKHAIKMFFLHAIDTFAGPPWSAVVPWPDSHIGYDPPHLFHISFVFFSSASNLFVSYLIAPLAFYAMWRRRREDGMWYLFTFPIGSLLFSAVAFHGDPRFRSPYDFFFFIAAALAYVELKARWDNRHAVPEIHVPLRVAVEIPAPVVTPEVPVERPVEPTNDILSTLPAPEPVAPAAPEVAPLPETVTLPETVAPVAEVPAERPAAATIIEPAPAVEPAVEPPKKPDEPA